MHIYKLFKNIVFLILIFSCFNGLSVDMPKGDTANFVNRSNYLNRIDSLIIYQYTSFYACSIERNNYFLSDSNLTSSSNLIEQRLLLLNNETPIDLEYNEIVLRYIELYLETKRDLVAKMVGSAKLYYPIFEEKLDKYDLPLELKHLAIVESALNPLARSKSGAIGLWQFLFDTGTMMGLKITSYIDERRDPCKSTEAACQYLEFLYSTFDDWQLALAAYNGGPTVVRNAIILSGGKTNYWDIRPYLPEQTQGYVPAFIAVNFVMNYYEDYGITPVEPLFLFYNTDTVTISKPVSLSTIADNLKIPIANMKFLNPVYKQYYVPESALPAKIVLPKEKVSDFLRMENQIFSDLNNGQDLTPANYEKHVKIEHIVNNGEYLHLIALKYKCSIDDIRIWNNLKTDALNSGQTLLIWIQGSQAYRYNDEIKSQKSVNNNAGDQFVYYTFQENDNFEELVGRLSNLHIYEVLEINNFKDKSEIKPGTKIKIDYKK
ncbi:MAG: transglycosylase SLT domain-containing protein [Bacteroidota bacterium]